MYMYVCLRVCQVVVIKDRGNVAVDLKLMMCSSGYCVRLDVINTHTHTHTSKQIRRRHFSYYTRRHNNIIVMQMPFCRVYI
jgi:hypothetical protein